MIVCSAINRPQVQMMGHAQGFEIARLQSGEGIER
jgi:hypothetical protein